MGAFGRPFEQPTLRSIVSTLIVEPTIGYDVAHVATNLPLGATPNSDNFIMREGRLEPRPTLSLVTDSLGLNNSTPGDISLATPLTGGLEIVDVNDLRYIYVSYSQNSVGLKSHHWLQGFSGTWRAANPTNGVALTLAPDTYWDWVQAYYDAVDNNAALGVTSERQGIYAWVAGATSYSTLTSSPGATCLAVFDHYVLAGNVEDGGNVYPQRVMWSDRGSISSWTGGLSGFDDLLGARGGINRMMNLDNRVAVFFDDEIWMGMPVDFPSTFRFIPFDSHVGCPYPWTVANTPKGPLFMARNFQLYLLPKEGGSPVPVGQPIHRSIRDAIVSAPKAHGVYDGIRDMYQFNYSSGGSGNLPHNAVWLDLNTGAWAPQSFSSRTGAAQDIALTRGFQANLPTSRGSTWDDYSTASIAWDAEAMTWDDMLGIGSERQSVIYGTSSGSVLQLNSRGTNDLGRPVVAFWETKKLGDEWPGQQKTVTKVQADYSAASNSTLTVRTLAGGTFSTGTRMQLPASSAGSQAEAYPYTTARYAAVRFESESQRDIALERFFVTMRVGGR